MTVRSSPTGRIPQWALDEALGRPTVDPGWRSWSPAEEPSGRRRRRRRRRSRSTLRDALVVVVVISALLLTARLLGISTPGNARPADWPSPGHEAADAPLGTPLPAPNAGGAHGFLVHQENGTDPVAYDPCRPIHYVIRPDNAPPGGEALVHDAFTRVSAITGLRFVYDGATDEELTEERENFQPDRYGDRWAPVLVSWQTAEEEPQFATDVAGLAGSSAVQPPGGPRVFVTGAVALDAADFAQMLADPMWAPAARGVVLHEVGHLVGLAHVSDPGQLMHPRGGDVVDFAPGDLSGLAVLGRGECVPDV